MKGDSVYAIARGNGIEWELIDLQYKNQEGDTVLLSIIRDLFVKHKTSICFFSGSIFEWDKSSKMTSLMYSRLLLDNTGGTIDKSFGIGPDDIWGVGRGGSIVYYNGTTWDHQSSGTTVDLTDIWGTPDGSSVWACGYSSDGVKSTLLEYKNGNWKTLWIKDGSLPVSPFDYLVSSVWYKKNLYVAAGNRIFKIKQGVATIHSPSFTQSIRSIRGIDENDIYVVTSESAIWHYNGSTWKKVYFAAPSIQLSAIAISGRTLAAVGTDFSSFPNRAIVVILKRL